MIQNKKKYIKIAVALVLFSIVVQSLCLGAVANSLREKKQMDAYVYGQSVADSIQLTLDNSLAASESLKYFYANYGEEFFEDFDDIAEDILNDNPVISSIYIAPKAVIELAYPKEIIGSTKGFEMLKDPEQGPRAQLAIDTKKITVAGPHYLVEGGVGLIVRNPVYNGDEFAGFSIVVLDWDRFVEKVMDNTPGSPEKYKFAVWKEDHDENAVTDDTGYILKNFEGDISKNVDIDFSVPNDTWHLVVEPVDGWSVYRDMTVAIILSIAGTLIAITFILFVIIFEERRRLLQNEIRENETKEKYMQQLTEALERARKADAAKSNFLSRMSHDIRTPLNGIIGLIEINTKHAEDKELVDENRAKAKVAANHLLSLISDILELSKMEDDNVFLSSEPIDMVELARDIRTISQLRASESGINLTFIEDESVIKYPYVYCSPLHVRQIFLNILSNAIKYNKPNGSVSGDVKIVSCDDKIVVYQVVIKDTGIGMSPEFMEHMFEPFSQEHHDARSEYQGTGLGMAIVKRIVDKMVGKIDVESEVGVGTTFTVTLPFAIASEEDIIHPSEEKYVDLTAMKVLLAEDNDLNMEIAKIILEDMGVLVSTVRNGQEAVDAYLSKPEGTFDVILMDIMMPVMDGYEATRAIRNSDREGARTIPIIAMTANAFDEDEQKCYSVGMNGHITKPIDIAKLSDTLGKIHRGR